MLVYKLTRPRSEHYRTCGDTRWGPGVTHESSGSGELCSSGWIHVYSDPLLGRFMDPIHGNFGEDGVVWRCKAEGKTKDDHGLKMGVQKCTTLEILNVPVPTSLQRVRFAIGCAWSTAGHNWRCWATNWLNGSNRTREAAGLAWAEAAWAARAAAAAAVAAVAAVAKF